MPPLPRGRCPDCGKVVALRVGGQTREHSSWGGAGMAPVKCPGSGKQAKS
jgi:hypothetical protein